MTSTRLWRPAVLVKTGVWVGCSVSPAHKNWSRSFFIFKDFPSGSLPITPLAPAFLPLKSDPQQRHEWIQTTLITGTRCHGKPIKSVATPTNPRVVTNLSAVDLNKYINGLYGKCKKAYWSWRQSNEQVIKTKIMFQQICPVYFHLEDKQSSRAKIIQPKDTLVCYTAVLVSLRNGEERCVTTLKTAV